MLVKNLLPKAEEIGDNPILAMMLYCNTSLGIDVQSPMELLYERGPRSNLPKSYTMRMKVQQACRSSPQAEVLCPTTKNQERAANSLFTLGNYVMSRTPL